MRLPCEAAFNEVPECSTVPAVSLLLQVSACKRNACIGKHVPASSSFVPEFSDVKREDVVFHQMVFFPDLVKSVALKSKLHDLLQGTHSVERYRSSQNLHCSVSLDVA